ncbi:MAG: hypothetical protein HY075_09165 [Deltaproteobacteria bacterium]|nr:hypothetical protein [Deltaproteobacteria bacterium]
MSLSGVGKTPFVGAQVDMNLIPYVGLGVGYGYFSVDTVSGSFIPVFATVYPLTGSFSPFVEGGLDFLTVKFQSANSLLNSTFRGTQLIVGVGAEYRFDFGLLLRAELVRFINAQLWSPGAAAGYSIAVF